MNKVWCGALLAIIFLSNIATAYNNETNARFYPQEKKPYTKPKVGESRNCGIYVHCACGGGEGDDTVLFISAVVKKYDGKGVYLNDYYYIVSEEEGKRQNENAIKMNKGYPNHNFHMTYKFKGDGKEKIYVNVYDYDLSSKPDELGSTREFDIFQKMEETKWPLYKRKTGELEQCKKNARGGCSEKYGEVVYSCPVY